MTRPSPHRGGRQPILLAMPTLTLVLNTPHSKGSDTSGTIESSERSGTIDDARSSVRIGESITANERVARSVAQAKATGDIIDVDAPTPMEKLGASMELTKVKKRKSSILEQLNYNDDDDDDDDDEKKLSSVEKENFKMAASNSTSNSKKQKTTSTKKATTTKKTETKPPTNTLLDFFSSNKPSTHTIGDESAKKTDVEDDNEVKDKKKKKKKRSFVKLNEKAKPIDVHIAFAGEEKRTTIVIKEHCLASKYDMGKEPIVLNGTYPAESKRDIENFLSGFGKYCM